MSRTSRVVHFSEEPDSMDKALPFSVEETGNANDGASGETLPEENLDIQQAIIQSLSLNATSSTSSANPCLHVIVKYGNLEQQKVDVLAFPLLATNPNLNVLNITKDLEAKAGKEFSNLFTTVLTRGNKPDSCIDLPTVGARFSLDCKRVMFINCNIWNPASSSPEKDLRDGISRFLDKCNSNRDVKSVAISAIGTGRVLNFPNELAATIMGEEIKGLVDRHPNTNIKEIQIVIKQLKENETVYIAYREILLAMDLGQRIKLCNEHGGDFNSIALGDHTKKTAGCLKVYVVYGDIGEETTSAIVNSTNFTTWGEHSVANRIFTAAGNDILKKAQKGHNTGKKLVVTTAGELLCGYILHGNCGGSLNKICELVTEILNTCEHLGLESVAIPAIGTGECKFRPEHVSKCIMEGILPVTHKPGLKCLSCVRLVVYSPYMYHTFCAELNKYFI
ncbi:protein mono-ADP-ribosyltransferase PARP14-like isoform X1 [Bufo gargarizans]|uniref:protein mono-ADP-ribosyltransferase PARP14-like isoform X1 n=2 Tax=Bufo gargarizans TaxID=30331 RepID=UPI001CF483D3|nr:protein mono-ADP-ribosyltransferase PARP14-like isoform X1 [Bufo gargarizans]